MKLSFAEGFANLDFGLTSGHRKTSKVLVGCASLLSALALSAPAAQAATFTVEFTGTVTDLTRLFLISFTPSEESGLSTLSTPTTGKTVDLADRLIGSYTFDDATNEITSARLRFVSSDSSASLDPAESNPLDITLEAIPEAPTFPSSTPPVFPIIRGSSQADQSSALYSQTSTTVDTSSFTRLLLSTNQSFEYEEGFSRRGGSGEAALIEGMLDSLTVVEIDTPPAEPVDVPEPAAAVGLLLVSGLGLVSRRSSEKTS